MTNGNYYVRVQGVNNNGPGTWSLNASYRLASTRPTPGQPRDLTLTTAGTGQTLSVAWEKPDQSDPSRQPTHYLVQWQNVTTREGWSSTLREPTVTVTDPAVTDYSHSIPNLASGNQYQVRVQAINRDIAGIVVIYRPDHFGRSPCPDGDHIHSGQPPIHGGLGRRI